MTGQEDRQKTVGHIEVACREGARLKPACEMAGLDVRTLQRWFAGQPGSLDDAERVAAALGLGTAEVFVGAPTDDDGQPGKD